MARLHATRVVISRGLFEGVSADELADRCTSSTRATTLRNLDTPLKVMIGRALLATFLFLPALGALKARYVAARELAADRQAVQVCWA